MGASRSGSNICTTADLARNARMRYGACGEMDRTVTGVSGALGGAWTAREGAGGRGGAGAGEAEGSFQVRITWADWVSLSTRRWWCELRRSLESELNWHWGAAVCLSGSVSRGKRYK